MKHLSVSLVTEAFLVLMHRRMPAPTEIKADTCRIERFHVEGDKPGSKNGWYVLHTDFPPVGLFGCHKRNIHEVFRYPIHRNLVTDRIRQEERLLQISCQANNDLEKFDTIERWYSSSVATDRCRYLLTKKVKAHGLRYYKGAALVPVMDAAGNIHGYQALWPDGRKGFAPGTDKKGHFYIIGKPGKVILIAEGYATAATLYEATEHTTVVAFDSGNLLLVSLNIRAMFPDACIVLCADNDQWGEVNTGLTAATAAVEAVGCLLVVPYFPVTTTAPTDFNDLLRLEGPQEVREQVDAVLGGDHV